MQTLPLPLSEDFREAFSVLSAFEKCQLLSILALCVQELEERVENGNVWDEPFSPLDACNSMYPYETTSDVLVCLDELSQPVTSAKDLLQLIQFISEQLPNELS